MVVSLPHRLDHRRFRTGVLKSASPDGETRMLFVWLHRDGRLGAVIDAKDIEDAWVIATGWGDTAEIEERQEAGERIYPCMVEWTDH